jgi:UDP-glucose 4-epimerase
LETVALRLFNVFGPRQRPDSAYAAVIPIFIDALRDKVAPVVHGDGLQSRDFTYIDDTVEAYIAAARAPAERCAGSVYNVAGGGEYTLLDLLAALEGIMGVSVAPEHTQARAGDVRRSCADARAAGADLGWGTAVGFEEGLRRTVEWLSARG